MIANPLGGNIALKMMQIEESFTADSLEYGLAH
jgi:hypothetical protein